MTEVARRVTIRVEPLTAEAYAPFGTLVTPERQLLWIDPGQYTARLMTLEPLAKEIRHINRHPDHIQLFVPSNDRPFYLVVAPAEMTAASFDPARIRIFLNDGTQSITFGKNVWHIAPRAVDGELTVVVNVQGSRQFEFQEDLDMSKVLGTVIEVAR